MLQIFHQRILLFNTAVNVIHIYILLAALHGFDYCCLSNNLAHVQIW